MPAPRKGGISRKSKSTSTPLLLVWGIVMLLVGIGIGVLSSGQGCVRKKPHRTETREPAPRPTLPRRSNPAPKPPEPDQLPSEAAPKLAEPAPKAPEPNPKIVEPAPKLVAEPPVREPEPTSRHRESGHAAPESRQEPREKLPRVALIIDDLGYAAPELVTRFCSQPIAFSVAVLPFQEFTKESAEIAHAHGKEVILHLPMEPIGYPGPSKDPGPGAIMFEASESETRTRVRNALDAVPHRQGVNNHMGSRITPDRKRMTWILEELKARRCFFVDSRTEKDSVAFAVAEALKVPALQRKVFLDDDKNYDEIAKQWDRAIAIAKKEGQVLVIGHIYPETAEALQKLIPRAKGEVTFVKAGDLVR